MNDRGIEEWGGLGDEPETKERKESNETLDERASAERKAGLNEWLRVEGGRERRTGKREREQRRMAGSASNELFEGDWKQTLGKWAENIPLTTDEMFSSLVCPSPFTLREIWLPSWVNHVFASRSVCLRVSYPTSSAQIHKIAYTKHWAVTWSDTCMCAVCTVTGIDPHPDCLLAETGCFSRWQPLRIVPVGFRSILTTSHTFSDTQCYSPPLYTVHSLITLVTFSLFNFLSCPCCRISWSAWLSVMSWRLKWTERAMKSMKVRKSLFIEAHSHCVIIFSWHVCSLLSQRQELGVSLCLNLRV